MQLAVIEPISIPDLRRPQPTTRWPTWVDVRLKAMSEESGSGWTLPQALMLHDHERELVTTHCVSLETALTLTPISSADFEVETNVAVTKMMLTLPAPKANEGATIAIGDAYEAALDDVPSWAVALALRGWYRGDHPGKHDFNWRPSPAALRALSVRIAHDVVGRDLATLKRLLAVTARREYSDEHKAEMLAKFEGLRLHLASVGKDEHISKS